jgi:hypothetical protein
VGWYWPGARPRKRSSVDVLDRCQVGDSEPEMPLTVGVTLRLDGSPLESLERAIGKSLERGTQGAACIENSVNLRLRVPVRVTMGCGTGISLGCTYRIDATAS